MVKELLKLADEIDVDWDRNAFPQVALGALDKLKTTTSIETFQTEIADWLISSQTLPKQLNVYNSFGEPPITLFNNGQFAIDVYFWRKNDTLIHSHAFRGAFKVLYGQSLHEEFSVEVVDKAQEDLVTSHLESINLKVMTAGECQIILPGTELVHRVVHLDNPTVSLCLRTVEDTTLNQWHHLSTGVSYQKRNIDESTIKRVLYFQFLCQSDPSLASTYLQNLLKGIDSSSQLNLYESIFFDELGLEYSIACSLLDTLRDRFLKTTWFDSYERHFSRIAEHLKEHAVSKPELKLLAHAINSDYSAQQLKKLLGHFPDSRPIELYHQLLGEHEIFTEAHEPEQRERINLHLNQFREMTDA